MRYCGAVVGGVLVVVVVVVAFVPVVGCAAGEAIKMASTLLGNVADFMASRLRDRGIGVRAQQLLPEAQRKYNH